MRSDSVRRNNGGTDGVRADAWRFVAKLALVFGVSLIVSIESALAFSTTNPGTTKTPSDSAFIADERVPTNPINESPQRPKAESDDSTPSTGRTEAFPSDRAEILNEHLRRELLAQQQPQQQQPIDGIGADIGKEIMEAALVSARDPSSSKNCDSRFERPALEAYRSFVYSDQHASDPLLLNGLAIKTAKQIRNMVQQTAKGIVSPSQNEPLQGDHPPEHFRKKIANSIAKGERRAKERNHRKLRDVCGGCSRPFNLCLCGVLNQSKSNDTDETANKMSERMVHSEVIVLQHPNEFRKKHTSTVPLLKMVLGDENVRIKVGYEFTMNDIVTSDADDKHHPIMLFPGPDAIDLDKYVAATQQRSGDLPFTESNEKPRKKHTLVLIDGTWAEAKRIIRDSPEILEGCQMVQFAFEDDLDDVEENPNTNANATNDLVSQRSSWPTTPESDRVRATKSRSIYHAMRKEPEEHCLSTLEACGEALRTLEGSANGPRLQEALKSVLSKHVELHLKNAREAAQSRHNRDTASRESKLRRSKEIERSIYGEETNDCVVDSEQNDRVATLEPTTIASTPTRLLPIDSYTNVTIRRLTHEDIPVIDGLWDNGGTPKSVMTITRSIDADYRLGIGASLGIVDDESNTSALVAGILRYESGPLGILYVSEEHRGKGYGTALLREATRLVSEARTGNGLLRECSAFIKDGNIASERVFEKVGYVRENPNAKKRTGKRRANRKWIYPARHTEEDET